MYCMCNSLQFDAVICSNYWYKCNGVMFPVHLSSIHIWIISYSDHNDQPFESIHEFQQANRVNYINVYNICTLHIPLFLYPLLSSHIYCRALWLTRPLGRKSGSMQSSLSSRHLFNFQSGLQGKWQYHWKGHPELVSATTRSNKVSEWPAWRPLCVSRVYV